MAFLVVAGRLAQDSELKKIQSGTSVLKFSVPDKVGWGEKKTTQWIACAIWGKRGEALYEHLKRGSIVEVCGSPVINTYQTKAGEFKAEMQLSVNDIKLLGNASVSAGGSLNDVNQAPGKVGFDDEIPF